MITPSVGSDIAFELPRWLLRLNRWPAEEVDMATIGREQ